MMKDTSFLDLFDRALEEHRHEFSVEYEEIQKAITVLQNEYSPRSWKLCSTSQPVNYNEPAFRCAYLHKYASCHASLVQTVILQMLEWSPSILQYCFCDNGNEPVRICCLGGGPGTDAIGLSSVLCVFPEFHRCCFLFVIVDCMTQWSYALSSVSRIANHDRFGPLGSFVSYCKFLQADLLSELPETVKGEIRSANMITMVKFVSAAACETTPNMLKAVFTLLKPGAFLLFIDNAAGGFYEMVSEAAYLCGLSTVCGPFRHLKFENEIFKRKKFGFFSLSSTTVAAQMWRKSLLVSWNQWENRLAFSTTQDLCSVGKYTGRMPINKKRKITKGAPANLSYPNNNSGQNEDWLTLASSTKSLSKASVQPKLAKSQSTCVNSSPKDYCVESLQSPHQSTAKSRTTNSAVLPADMFWTPSYVENDYLKPHVTSVKSSSGNSCTEKTSESVHKKKINRKLHDNQDKSDLLLLPNDFCVGETSQCANKKSELKRNTTKSSARSTKLLSPKEFPIGQSHRSSSAKNFLLKPNVVRNSDTCQSDRSRKSSNTITPSSTGPLISVVNSSSVKPATYSESSPLLPKRSDSSLLPKKQTTTKTRSTKTRTSNNPQPNGEETACCCCVIC